MRTSHTGPSIIGTRSQCLAFLCSYRSDHTYPKFCRLLFCSEIYISAISQQCYSQPNCVAGSEIEIPADTPTQTDCCTGTNGGRSYADGGGTCIAPQCVGKNSLRYLNTVPLNIIIYVYSHPNSDLNKPIMLK